MANFVHRCDEISLKILEPGVAIPVCIKGAIIYLPKPYSFP
jgi:hypothetical protein